MRGFRAPWVMALALASAAASWAQEPARTSSPDFVSDRIGVITRGAGRDIILIPGLASHRDVWNAVADELDDRYRLHVVQVNGFAGFAAAGNADGPVVAPVAEEIARYIRDTRLQRPAIIGHSMGGAIGLMIAARHPDLVGRLMPVDITPFLGVMFGPAADTPEGLRAIADKMRAQLLAEPPDSPTGMLAQMFSTMTRSDEMRPVLVRQAGQSDPRTVANAFHELIMTDLRPELARITTPTTVLFVIPQKPPIPADQYEASMRSAYASVPHITVIRIDDSNHFIQIDQPARFVAEVDAFMKRN